MEEYFDILDELGNPTGEVRTRKDAHALGLWHKAVHIWIINDKNEILLQRRCATKDSYPNKLDISCAGHLSSGDDSVTGALRELKEELNLEVKEKDLKYLVTLKQQCVYKETFINNEYIDMYLLRTDKDVSDMKFQEEEISEIFYVSFDKFREMYENKQKDFIIYEDEFPILFEIFDEIKKGDN